MLLNLHIVEANGSHCARCGQRVVNAQSHTGLWILLNGAPDPLGMFHIAWHRGDNGEHLAHHPALGQKVPGSVALLAWRYDAIKPLYGVHRCTG